MEEEKQMEANKISKQAINFQKMTFENWYKAMTLMQDQAVSTMDKMLDQEISGLESKFRRIQ